MSTATSAWAHGLATVSTDSATEGSVLDVWFPHPHLGERPADDPADGPADLGFVRTGAVEVRVNPVPTRSGGAHPPPS